MKKRILSALLCLCMVFGLVPVTVWAATWNGHTHYLCGGSTCNGSGHENESSMTTFAVEIKQVGGALYIGNTEWPVSAYGSYALDGGVYYLSTNLTPDHMIQCNGNVTLCLNGHSITANHDGDVIAVNSGVTFTLTDCKGGNSDAAFGKITHAPGKNGGGVYVHSGTFKMYGGEITGNKINNGGGVFVDGKCTFEMYGGSITGNTATSQGGGGVYVTSNGSFTMTGGSITGNTVTTSSSGGGVYMSGGTFTMSGGSITNNKAGSLGVGGGVYVTSKGSFTMSASDSGQNIPSITGNTANVGGGVYVDGGSFKMSGGTISSNTARSGGGVYVYRGCTFEMSSGTISSNTATGNGGGVYVEGTFTMSGGSIGGTNANEANTAAINGGGVYVAGGSSTFKMTGGSITGNTATNAGGGVYVNNSGSFTMSASDNGQNIPSITGNNANSNGGGVYVASGSNTFKMTGGSITGNNADSNGGGVYVGSGTFTVSGKVTVTDNTKGGTKGSDGAFTGGTKNNVYLPPSKTITVDGALTDSAKIGVTLDSNYGDNAFTSGWNAKMGDNNPADYFISDVGGKGFEQSNGEVKLCDGHTHYLCGGSTCNGSGHEAESSATVFAKEIKQEGDKLYIGDTEWLAGDRYALSAGSYCLSTDLTLDAGIKITGNVTLCLNGHSITANHDGDVIAVNSGATFTLTDCKGGNSDAAFGKITHASGKDGRGVYVEGRSATFNMYGGSIAGNNMFTDDYVGNDEVGGGVYIADNGATFNMYGGTICGNTAGSSGGGVYMVEKTNFNMYGGTICGNTATRNFGGGVCVYKNGNFNMSGGEIGDNGARCGGGVFVDDYSTLTMTGGSITGNNVSGWRAGGGIYISDSAKNFTVSGNIQITGNMKRGTKNENGKYTGGKVENLYLLAGETVTVGGTLTNGAKLGVTLANNYGDNAFTSGWGTYMGTKTPADYFTSDVDGYEAKLYDTELKLVSTHVHSWTYTANGDKITATCKSCEDNNGQDYVGGTCTVTASDAAYDGNGKAATVSKTGIFENVNITITYSKYNAADGMYHPINTVPTDAGKYKASFTLGNVTVSVTYTINKATQTAPTGLTTKGDIKNSGTGEIQNTAENMEYNISANATTGWITCDNGSTRVAPGTYYVRYKETDNYYASDVSAALTVDAHIHSGGNATCQEKAVCDGCGQKYGELGNHNFTETVGGMYLKSAATCQSPAVYYKSCLVCDEKSSETFEYGEKDFSNHIGNTYLVGQKEATCYAEGYTGDTYCSTCNHEIEKGTSIAKNAHNPASVWTTDETDHWKECQTVGCGNIIDKAHHSGGEATCVKKAICSVCKVEYGAVDPSNHKHTEVRGAKDATCCEKGYTGDTYCTDCNALISSGAEIPATGNHTDADGKWETDGTNHWHTCYFGTKFDITAHNGGEATCKNQAECSECGHSYGSLDASNHKGTTYLKNQKEATCYDEGYTGDTYCSDCNEKIADGQSIAKNAHNPASVWTTDEHDHWKECQTVGCGNVIDKAAHSGGEATCVSKAVCEVCNAQYGDIDATNHKHSEIRDAKPATEQEKGYTGDTWCTDCNKKIATGSEIAMLEHKLKLVEAKDATVTEQGNIKYYYCEDCGKNFADEDGTKEISLSETVIKKLPPEIIEGNNATVNNGEKKSLTFRSNAAFTDFIRVELDGKTLDEKDYTKAEGSIIVTLNSDFVSTLSVGEHTLGIVSESGTATAKFTVKASEIPNESPKTGDDNMVAIWSFAAVLSLAVLGFTTVGSKKKRAK